MISKYLRNFRCLAMVVPLVVLSVMYSSEGHALDLNPLTIIKDALETVVEDRSVENIATDTRIKAEITTNVVEKMGSDVISINSDVYEQEVMLTGIVENTSQRDDAAAIVRTVSGVKHLYNEILIKSDMEQEQGAVEKWVDDTIIETKINAQLLDAKGVNVTNFRYRSVAGHVFLFGRALSAPENAKATEIARGIENVRSVVNLVKVRSLLED